MLLDEIKQGESKVLEFKEKLPSDSKKYVKTVIAFSNGAGGKLVIGVNNANNEIVGIDPEEDVFELMDNIANAISDTCEPQIIPNIYPATVEGKTVIVVEVVRGSLQPYYLKSLGKENGTYIRVGATSRLASNISLSEMELKSKNITFDSLPCLKFEVNDEVVNKCCDMIYESKLAHEPRLVNRTEIKKVRPQNLINWKLLIEENEQLVASNAFALVMQEDDTYFDNSRVQCAVFKGTTRAHFIDKKEYSGSVLELIELAYNFVIRHINVGLKIDGLYSSPDYEIDPFIIRELLNNAFHHRSYIDDGAIQVCIFDDRIEITSPGSIYNSLTIEQIINGRTSSRNKVLTRLFKEMGLIEEWGTGLQRVIERCREIGLSDPKFEDLDTAFRVSLIREKEMSKINDKMSKNDGEMSKINDKMSKIDKVMSKINLDSFSEVEIPRIIKLLEYILENNFVTVGQTTEILDIGVKTCRRLLTKCKQEGILTTEGKTKDRKYYLTTK